MQPFLRIAVRRPLVLRALFGLLLVAGLTLCLTLTAASAKVRQSQLGVDLANKTNVSIAQIQFTLISTNISAKMNQISVAEPGGKKSDRYNINGIASDGALKVSFIGLDIVRITLTPLKVYAATDNVKFILTVPGATGIRIAQANYFDNNGKALSPRPMLPGFTVVTKDAEYTAFDDVDDPFKVDDLTFQPNSPITDIGGLDFDALFAATFDPSDPNFTLLADGGSSDFPGLPDPDPGDSFIAEGQILDPGTSEVLGSFIHAVDLIPEPATISLLLVGFGGLIYVRRRSRRQFV